MKLSKTASLLLHAAALFLLASIFSQAVFAQQTNQRDSIASITNRAQPKLVKIFGSGGLQRLESFQTGIFVSQDGLILTSYTYVLGKETNVVLHDGQRLPATLLGFDSDTEVALLKVNTQQQPHFRLNEPAAAEQGQKVLAISNLYGIANGNESCSLQVGVIASIESLKAKRGNRRLVYRGRALILDAITNNPGATGGAVLDRQGKLLGMIGRESKHVDSELWLNYAIPVSDLDEAVDAIQNKRPRFEPNMARPTEPMTVELLGIQLLPNVVKRTPPYIDELNPEGSAALAGLMTDDLIVELNSRVITSQNDLLDQLNKIDRDATIRLTIRREGQFMQIELKASNR